MYSNIKKTSLVIKVLSEKGNVNRYLEFNKQNTYSSWLQFYKMHLFQHVFITLDCYDFNFCHNELYIINT